MYNDNALFLAVTQRPELAGLTVIDDIAGIAPEGVSAAENVHQRGFSGAVLAHKSVYLAAPYFEVHIIERLDTGELLNDVLHFKYVFRQAYPSFNRQ